MTARILLVITVLLAGSVSSQAGTCFWGAFNGEFTDPYMWWDREAGVNRVPGISDTAVYFTDTVCTLGAGKSATIYQLYLGEWCQTGLPHNSTSPMVIDGSLTATTISVIGCSNVGTPTMRGHLTINEGGSFTDEQGLIIGKGNNGTLTMNGGSLNVTWWISLGCDPWSNDDVNTPGIGTINLNGGTIAVNQLYMGSDASKIIVAGGVLEINIFSRVPYYLANNQIVAADGYTLNIDYSYNMGFGVRITATGPLQGDMDGDKKVNFKDFAIFASSWFDGM